MKIKCTLCNKEYKELFKTINSNIIYYEHDCIVYERLYHRKRISKIKVKN